MIPKCQAKHDEAQAAFRAFFTEYGKRETAIERYYDQYMCVSALRKIFEEQFQTGITQIIG